jgi:hypothetical protein
MSEVDKFLLQAQGLKKDPWVELSSLDNLCQNISLAAYKDCPKDAFDLSLEHDVWKKVFEFIFGYDVSRRAWMLAEELGCFLSGDPGNENGYKQDCEDFIRQLHDTVRKTAPS